MLRGSASGGVMRKRRGLLACAKMLSDKACENPAQVFGLWMVGLDEVLANRVTGI